MRTVIIPRDIFSIEFILVLMLFPQIYGDLTPYRINIFVNLIAIVYILYLLFFDDGVIFTKNFFIAFGLYLVFISYAAISVLWGPSPDYSFSKLARLFTLAPLLMIVSALVATKKERVYRLLRCTLFVSLIVSVVSVYTLFDPKLSPWHILPPDSHIGIGRVIGIGLPIALFFVINSTNNRDRLLNIFFILLLLLSFLPSNSRAPVIASILSVIVLVTMYYKNKGKKVLLVLVAAITSLLTTILLVGPNLPTIDRVSKLLRGDLDSSAISRLEQYELAYQFWLESPVLGNGIGSFPILRHGPGHEYRDYPHNIFLEVLSELGLVGFLLLSFILMYSILTFTRNHNSNKESSIIFAIFAYSIINASISFDLANNRLLFFSIGLLSTLFVNHNIVRIQVNLQSKLENGDLTLSSAK